MGKRKKHKLDGDPVPAESDCSSDDNTDENKYKPFKIDNYTRQYPEDGGNFEYIVIYESLVEGKPIGDRDLMSLGAVLKRHNKGIKRFKRINRFKIGAIFERPGLANMALNNTKSQAELHVKCTIPASLTEITGVIRGVPSYMSNYNIYNGISSSKDVVSVRRLMRRGRDEDLNPILIPTQTVAITFSCPSLPDSVDINSWFFEVSPYIPPVSQCLRCLRFGHIGKFCKNAQKCSICGDNHHYKQCDKALKDAICIHCKGNHISISSECPKKKEEIEKNNLKYKKRSYADVFNSKNFPELPVKPENHVQNLLKSDVVLNLIISTILKLYSQKSSPDQSSPLTSETIKSVLLETFNSSKPINKNNGSA